MGFFNEDFYKDLDKNYDPEEEEEFDFDDDEEVDTTYYGDNIELEVNKSNREKFKDIMDNASVKYDTYWDLNNPVVKVTLIVLGVIIAIGIVYYILGWISMF